MTDILAVAHRGYSQCFPENSRAGCEGAIRAGADYVEADARLSADGVLICSHDPDFTRIAGRGLVIADTSSERLAVLDIGGGEPPMRLSEVLDITAGRAKVLVDVKTTEADLSDTVLDCLKKAGALDRAVVGLRSVEQLRRARGREPNARFLGLVNDYDAIPDFFALGAVAVRAWEDDMGHPAVTAALADGLPVWATAGRRRDGERPGHITANRVRRLTATGVRAILLNDPTLITGRCS